MRKKWIIGSVLVFFASGVILRHQIIDYSLMLMASPRDEIEMAERFRANGDFQRAFIFYKNAAKSGLPEAKFFMGRAYENGEGTGKDLDKAITSYLDASNSGLPEAQVNLGLIYKRRAKEGDAEKAIQWTRRAAESGDVNACCNLAKWYLEGTLVQKSVQESLKWRAIAAKAGDGIACYRLGLHYLDGNGVEKDVHIARKYFEDALKILSVDENSGELSAVLTLANMYRKGLGTSIDFDMALENYYIANFIAESNDISIKQDIVQELECKMNSNRIAEIKFAARVKFQSMNAKIITQHGKTLE